MLLQNQRSRDTTVSYDLDLLRFPNICFNLSQIMYQFMKPKGESPSGDFNTRLYNLSYSVHVMAKKISKFVVVW